MPIKWLSSKELVEDQDEPLAIDETGTRFSIFEPLERDTCVLFGYLKSILSGELLAERSAGRNRRFYAGRDDIFDPVSP